MDEPKRKPNRKKGVLPAFGRYLRRLRQARARRASAALRDLEDFHPRLTKNVVSEMERGNTQHIKEDVLRALSKAYDVPFAVLLFRYVKELYRLTPRDIDLIRDALRVRHANTVSLDRGDYQRLVLDENVKH
jgi:transcriptional regulator with XRE-family HTH domain